MRYTWTLFPHTNDLKWTLKGRRKFPTHSCLLFRWHERLWFPLRQPSELKACQVFMLFRYARPLPQGQPSSLSALHSCLLVYLSAKLWIITGLHSAVSLLFYLFFMHHLLAHLSLFISFTDLSISPFNSLHPLIQAAVLMSLHLFLC